MGKEEIAELPYLPPELWTRILSKTDVHTCFNCRNFVAARALLQTQAGRDKAFEDAALGGHFQDLQLLVGKMNIRPIGWSFVAAQLIEISIAGRDAAAVL